MSATIAAMRTARLSIIECVPLQHPELPDCEAAKEREVHDGERACAAGLKILKRILIDGVKEIAARAAWAADREHLNWDERVIERLQNRRDDREQQGRHHERQDDALKSAPTRGAVDFRRFQI